MEAALPPMPIMNDELLVDSFRRTMFLGDLRYDEAFVGDLVLVRCRRIQSLVDQQQEQPQQQPCDLRVKESACVSTPELNTAFFERPNESVSDSQDYGNGMSL